jgi:hypothetical protein
MTYSDLREQNKAEYLRQHSWFGIFGWFPIRDERQFEAIHTQAMLAIANYGDSTWVQSFRATSASSDILDVVLSAVLAALGIPPIVSPLLELAVKFVIQLLLQALQQQFAATPFGGSTTEFFTQVQQWATQASNS